MVNVIVPVFTVDDEVIVMHVPGDLVSVFLDFEQGPPGKDGLPGHPGQRGETVSNEECLSFHSPVRVLL